jgi:CRISPR-associated endonuclease Cas2
MTWIVAYDIEDNRIRNRLSRYLSKKGVRLQKSVFVIEIESHKYRRFLADVRKIASEIDKVAVFRLCEGCRRSAVQITEEEKPVYVF